jgi:hypothetical protein
MENVFDVTEEAPYLDHAPAATQSPRVGAAMERRG